MNVVNFGSGADWNGQDGNLTTVGSAGATNYFGTSDMNGNVREWNDAVVFSSSGGRRGCSWQSAVAQLGATHRDNTGPADDGVGFRLANSSIAAVPEPSGPLTTAALVASSLLLRRRSKNSL